MTKLCSAKPLPPVRPATKISLQGLLSHAETGLRFHGFCQKKTPLNLKLSEPGIVALILYLIVKTASFTPVGPDNCLFYIRHIVEFS